MPDSTVQQIGFAAVVLVIVGAIIWGGKILLNWFTSTFASQQAQSDRLSDQLQDARRQMRGGNGRDGRDGMGGRNGRDGTGGRDGRDGRDGN